MNNEQLLQVIEQAAKDKSTFLDLSEGGKELSLWRKFKGMLGFGSKLTALPGEIGNLSNLTTLCLSNNQLTALPGEIGNLSNLTTLYLWGNQLTALPREIGNLSNLTTLYLWGNQLTALPGEIGNLSNLTTLYLSHNQLTALPGEIGNLSNLTTLSLYGNQLTALPGEIGNLSNLTELNLSNNQLTALPGEIGNLSNLTKLVLDGNPLTSPPPEIVAQGTKAILAYLRELLRDSEKQWVSKLLVVGEGGVGKTSLLKALRGEPFNAEESTTHGIAIQALNVAHPTERGVSMQLNAWDFGGQEIYHATHQFFLTNRSLFLVAWNARQGFEQGKLYYWLDTIQALAPESPILLVATHIDERSADLPYTELCSKYPQIKGKCEISSKTGQGIDTLRQSMAVNAAQLPLMGEIWPTSWLNAAKAIRSRPEKCLKPDELGNISGQERVAVEDVPVLRKWMHELGDILYFEEDSELNDIVILEPQWVTEYISKVLESDEVKENKGVLTHRHLQQLWQDLKPSLQNIFLHLMEKFDLSYPTDGKQDSLIVELLPLDSPNYQQKWEDIKQNDDYNEMSMKFKLNTIPAGIPTWFIARSHRFSTGIHWRNGALFADEPTEPKHLALVQAFPHERYLQLTVRGANPQNFFALLKDGIEVTLARFPGLKIERLIPCPCRNNCEKIEEFKYEQLQKRQKKTIECREGGEDISVTKLLFGLDINSPNGVTSAQTNLTETVLLKRIEELEEKLAQGQEKIIEGQDQIRAELTELLELTQRGFSNAFHREQAKIESHCPSVFVILPRAGKNWSKKIIGQKFDLQLYCQEPGCWHPTPEETWYEIDEPAEWLKTMAPYINKLVNVLKFAAPLAGPWLGLVNLKDYQEQFKNHIEFMKELANQLQEIQVSDDGELAGSGMANDSDPERIQGAPLRTLRQLLDKKDPGHHWGGLRKILTPEGHYLWLCDHHAKKYDR